MKPRLDIQAGGERRTLLTVFGSSSVDGDRKREQYLPRSFFAPRNRLIFPAVTSPPQLAANLSEKHLAIKTINLMLIERFPNRDLQCYSTPINHGCGVDDTPDIRHFGLLSWHDSEWVQ